MPGVLVCVGAQKNDWWAKRKAAADQIAKDTPLKVRVTQWPAWWHRQHAASQQRTIDVA